MPAWFDFQRHRKRILRADLFITKLLNAVNENEKNKGKDTEKGAFFGGQVKIGWKSIPELTKREKKRLFNYS